MKLIRSGGTNASLDASDPDYNKYGYGNYFMSQIKTDVDEIIQNGGTVAVCVAAKPNKDRYDEPLKKIGYDLDQLTILGRHDDADWKKYDAVLILGGETRELHSWLKRNDFSLDSLSKCKLLGGDSAGAYVLASHTIVDYERDGSSFEVIEGFLPDSKLLVAAHVNNPYYHLPSLGDALKKWCNENETQYLELEENEISISTI